jgi:hypothetical protein
LHAAVPILRFLLATAGRACNHTLGVSTEFPHGLRNGDADKCSLAGTTSVLAPLALVAKRIEWEP